MPTSLSPANLGALGEEEERIKRLALSPAAAAQRRQTPHWPSCGSRGRPCATVHTRRESRCFLTGFSFSRSRATAGADCERVWKSKRVLRRLEPSKCPVGGAPEMGKADEEGPVPAGEGTVERAGAPESPDHPPTLRIFQGAARERAALKPRNLGKRGLCFNFRFRRILL